RPDRTRAAERDPERPQPRERLVPPSGVLATVDEMGVHAERDVVEEDGVAHAPDVDPPLAAGEGGKGGDRVVRIEAGVAGEVVARPERDDRERQVALERHLRDPAERAVAA